MISWPKVPNKQLSPDLVSKAPDELQSVAPTAAEIDFLEELIGELASKLDASDAEVERLKGQQTVDQVRARLMAPYADKVYGFVLGYCIVVAVFLILAAFRAHTGFELSDTILAIIAGSTAVAVIGLIGMVVSGLFGSAKSEK